MRNNLLCILFCLLAGISACQTAGGRLGCGTVERDSTSELYVYYPDFTSLGLVCGKMPYDDSDVVFCAEAAFTHAIRRKFDHANIDGDHVCDGIRYNGAECKDNTGTFAYYGGRWHFAYPADPALLDSAAADSCGMCFGQTMLFYRKAFVMPVRNLMQVTHFRALCELDGRLCIIDSKDTVAFGRFLYLLASCGVENAIYLDMGRGWNHSWYREPDGTLRELFPYSHPYCTNWIVFRRKRD